MTPDIGSEENAFRLLSPAFGEGASIQVQYTCKGQNINPPLGIVGTPKEAKGLALIMHDPDAVGSDFTHWLLWDIPAGTENIAANSVPIGASQGKNDGGKLGYYGPCPPTGTGVHRYIFELYALSKPLAKAGEVTRHQLESAIAGNIISKSILTGLFGAD